jgi:hypothetical protein
MQRCASGSTVPSPKVVYSPLPHGTHAYDTDPSVCPQGYKLVGGMTAGGPPDGAFFSSGGAFNADNNISGVFDDAYVDCTNTHGCLAICLRMTFY